MATAFAAPTANPLAWSTALELPALLLMLFLLYAIGIVRHRPRTVRALRAARQRFIAFCLGLVTLYVALASPIDAIGEHYLFSVHMVQHVILIYLVPMLWLRGLPPAWLSAWVSTPGLTPLMRGLTHPVLAAVTFNVIFTAWHLPGLYEWALRDPLVHRLEHAMILVSAWCMWWPILSPIPALPRLAPGAQVLYVLGLGIGQIPVVAYLTFSHTVFYPTYEAAQRLVALSPLEDQQLGGIVMKLASTAAFVAVLGRAFRRWYREANARIDDLPQATQRSLLLPTLPGLRRHPSR
jgi:putative membrane protein